MEWCLSWRDDPRARALADRHYNRQTPGASGFVPPGRCVVLVTGDARDVWVTSWPFAEHVAHAWAGAWVNSLFRSESPRLSSALIRDAVAATRATWPNVPALGMVTFVDPAQVRRKRDPGRCFRRAGFEPAGYTRERRLLALVLEPAAMPEPAEPIGFQARLPLEPEPGA